MISGWGPRDFRVGPNPFDFGGIQELVYLLKAHEDGEEVKILAPSDSVPKRKIFISHSSSDKSIVNAFIKEILLLGCGLKPDVCPGLHT